MNYDVDDIKYKYSGKIETIKFTMFLIEGNKDLDDYTHHKIFVEVTAYNAKVLMDNNKKEYLFQSVVTITRYGLSEIGINKCS